MASKGECVASRISAAWRRYETAPKHLKDTAARRLRALQSVGKLLEQGGALMKARYTVAVQLQREGVRGASTASLGRWSALVAGVESQHWLAFLVPSYVGRIAVPEMPEAAWDLFKADFLRLEAPAATSCYERLQRVAKAEGWCLPSLRTFERRIARELPPPVLILARRGVAALDRLYPSQERDRSAFDALQAVNADGHRFDVFVRLPNGQVIRPVMVCVQDLYSGKLLAWRVGESESAELARLAFRDVVERYGIPEHAWLDNGRSFASKVLTGGTAYRFRFKVQPVEPVGMLAALGVEVHWTSPYNGQAKPIERAFRDLCDRVAKHPAFAGAYTGNRPDAKPENYGAKAVPLQEFVTVLGEEIAAHNERPGRRSLVCNGQSFNTVFAESYGNRPIKRATKEQLRELLLMTDLVSARPTDGAIMLAGNRYWAEPLVPYAGRKVMVRFDPDALHGSVFVYTAAGAFVVEALCLAAVGFADAQAAREHAKAKKAFKRATREQLDAERRLSAAEVAARLPEVSETVIPSATVIAPLFGKLRGLPSPLIEAQRDAATEAREQRFQKVMARMAVAGGENDDETT